MSHNTTTNLHQNWHASTLQDVKEILEVIMPKRDISDREILEIIKAKHRSRLSARESHHRRSIVASMG